MEEDRRVGEGGFFLSQSFLPSSRSPPLSCSITPHISSHQGIWRNSFPLTLSLHRFISSATCDFRQIGFTQPAVDIGCERGQGERHNVRLIRFGTPQSPILLPPTYTYVPWSRGPPQASLFFRHATHEKGLNIHPVRQCLQSFSRDGRMTGPSSSISGIGVLTSFVL